MPRTIGSRWYRENGGPMKQLCETTSSGPIETRHGNGSFFAWEHRILVKRSSIAATAKGVSPVGG